MRPALLPMLALLVAGTEAFAAGGLGDLCDARSPCGEGLVCREGFCLRDESAAPDAVPSPAPEAEPPEQKPKTPAPSPPAAPAPLEPKPAPPTATRPAERQPSTPPSPAPTTPPPATPAPPAAEEPAAGQAPEASGTPAPTTTAATPPPAAAPPPAVTAPSEQPAPVVTTPAVPSPEVREAAGAVRDEVWGALTPRGIALPVLACGGCLIGAGALTWGTSQTLGTAGTAGNLQGPNDTTAAALGVAGTFAGGLMVLLGVPVLLGGEVAALFAAVSDATAIGNALVVEDGLLTALAAGRAGAWLVSSQSLACGSGLCAAGGLGFLLHNVASGTSLAYDKGGAPILAELNNNAGLYALLGAVPVGLACASSLAALGADFGTVMVADPLAGEAEAEAEEASSSRPRRGDDGARLAARLQDAPIAY